LYTACLALCVAGKAGRTKRKKGSATPAAAAAAAPQADQQQQQGTTDETEAAAAGGGEQEVDVMAAGAADETPETWARLLAGLSQLCSGIGMALEDELCE
jgi:hypothetical protein